MLRQARRSALRATVAVGASALALEWTTRLPTQGRSSSFYHSLCDDVCTPAARTVLDPETAHNLAIEMTRRGWGPVYRDRGPPGGGWGGGTRRAGMSISPLGGGAASSRYPNGSPRPPLPPLAFPNPIGLAAGFDKDAIAVPQLFALGFGFVEVGTVTPLPQEGKPKPRMWRLTEDRGAINRYGFNSGGMEGVGGRLRELRGGRLSGQEEEDEAGDDEEAAADADAAGAVEPRPEDPRPAAAAALGDLARSLRALWVRAFPPPPSPGGVLGVNLGKNKRTPDASALDDYAALIRTLGPHADYLVINVSSPNTPGLRGLQNREKLGELLRECLRERDALARDDGGERAAVPPLLVKIAPDLDESEMRDVASVCLEVGIDGVVVSNTSTSRSPALASPNAGRPGGLSGAPIRDLSTEAVRTMFDLTDGRVPIVGVGGVANGRDAYDKIRAGASLVQVYTMMVYEGPGMVGRIREELEEILARNGHRDVEDAVGLDHEGIYWRRREERARREREEMERGAEREEVIVAE